MQFMTRPLDATTWGAFEALVEKHNGVWGGCWCMAFHEKPGTESAEKRRERKKQLVAEGRTHSAVVFHDDRAIGWCQYGSAQELPRIKNRKVYLGVIDEQPDWRITCFFVDKEYRGMGVATHALRGALDQIAAAGGGVVESYPEDLHGERTSSAFIHNVTIGLFEREGFERVVQIGKNRWVVRRRVEGIA